jgi:nucleotide-binding universal stress UspA family protein
MKAPPHGGAFVGGVLSMMDTWLLATIWIGYDGSEQAAVAFTYALDLAAKYGAEVDVVSVARPPEPPEMVETGAMLENARDHFKKGFAALRARAEAVRVTAHFSVAVGSPADQIIHHANEQKADLIVLGHRGKSRVKRWLLGSVSRRVTSYVMLGTDRTLEAL